MNKAINKELIKRGLSWKSNKVRHKDYGYSVRFVYGEEKVIS